MDIFWNYTLKVAVKEAYLQHRNVDVTEFIVNKMLFLISFY